MALAGFIKTLPIDFRLTVADVGSAGGLQDRWNSTRPWIEAMLFEPREDGVVRREGQETVYPLALAAAPGRATLNITRLANMSSTLLPNVELLSTFRKKGEDVEVVGHLEVPVDTLDRICASDGRAVDAIKVDTQGSELSILAGAGKALENSVLLAEVELSFLERYHDQALAADILSFMAEKGFDLIELHRPKRYRGKNRSNVVSPGLSLSRRSGRIAYADGIFFIQERRMLARIAGMRPGEAQSAALKAMLLLLIYGKPDLAARIFDLTGEYLDQSRRQTLEAWFGSLSHGSIGRRLLQQIAGSVGRRA